MGKEILLNGRSFTVIGVTPPEFGGAQLGVTRDLYVPMMMQAVMRPPRGGYSGERNPDLLRVRGNHWLFGVGRLKPGVTREQAQAALIPISQQQAEAFPDINRRRIVTLTAVNDGNPTERGRLISVAGLLMAVVGAVLLALGAPRRAVLQLMIGEGMKLVAVGVASGLAVAVAVTQWLSSFLYDVSAVDIVTFAGIPALLAVVALLACWIPARRATKVDPLVALRLE